MSGGAFSEAWLALREAADARARSRRLEVALAECLPPESEQRIVDLGSGAGANLRALSPLLGPRQRWFLLDADTGLATAARHRLTAFAERWEDEGAGLVLHRGAQRIAVAFIRCDLAGDPNAPFVPAPHLVTASAFFDLVSADWCAAFAARAAAQGSLVHAALTCDGRDRWTPHHPADAVVLAAFRAHQRGDKGFGPAAGTEATRVLAQNLVAMGYRVATAPSPWMLADERDLIAELADGIAGAAQETGHVIPERIADWRQARASAAHCIIGHQDLLAVPRRPQR